MQYNMLPGALWTVNTTEGNKNVDFNTLYSLVDYDNASVLKLYSTDKLVIDFDFGHRIHLDKFEYKFTAYNAISSAVASGIKFFSKNESFETYVSLSTLFHDNIFYTTTTSSIFAPRYVRISHTLSGTYGIPTASGIAYGFKALNNDTIVDFGIDGNKIIESVETAKGSAPIIKEVPIYNNNDKIADAFINLEPTFSSIDEVISISDSENGPWKKALETTDLIAGSSNFSYGVLGNTQFTYGPLRLSGVDDINGNYATSFSTEYYITKIFKKESTYCRFLINNISAIGHIHVNKTDAVETIEIRSSNAPPEPYMVIRELTNYYDTPTAKYYARYRDRWLTTQGIKEESSFYFLPPPGYSFNWQDYKVVYDQATSRWVGYAASLGGDSRGYAELYIFNNIGTSTKNYRLSYQTTGATVVNFSWQEMKLDYSGGMWIYFYCQSYHTGDFVHTTGYFLAYFDVNLTNTFKWFTLTEEIGKMDVDYNNKYVWYTRPTTNAIYKVNVNGDIIINFIDATITYKLGGIAVLPDGNLLFANDRSLHRLKYNGLYLSEYLIENVATEVISYIALDGDGSEAIWTIEGMTVGRLYVSGERKGIYDFRVLTDFPVRMTAVESGVWVHCADTIGQGGVVMRFISKANRRIDVEYRPSYNSSPAIIYKNYEHPNYASKLPIAIDTIWSNLGWNKIATNGFLTSEEQYYQLRITFRRQEPIERYPEFVTDSNQDFLTSDNFDQNEAIPKKLLWGDWRNYPNTNRVYVNTSTKKLVLTRDSDNISDSYISTNNRVLIGLDANNELDIRVNYITGAGNGIASGKSEYFHLQLTSVDTGHIGHYALARVNIASNITATFPYINICYNGNWTSNTATYGSLDFYAGQLRIYCSNSVLNGYLTSTTGATASVTTNVGFGTYGSNFFINMYADKAGSQVVIDDFNIYKGKVYNYSGSPMITSIYKQELIEIKDIYPNNYKNVYLKTSVPRDLEVAQNNEIDMKVRWRVPTN